MHLLLRIFSGFVIVVGVLAHHCQMPEYDEECRCDDTFVPHINMYCPSFENTVNSKSFEIGYRVGKYVEITCVNNPSWADFHYKIQSVTEEVKEFKIINCRFDENTNLNEISKLVGAENATSLRFENSVVHNCLTLRGCPSITKNHLKGFANLKILHISNIQLPEALSEDFLEPLSKVENMLEDLFQGSHEVKEIYLDENCLKILPKKMFKGLEKLQKLVINFNQIEYIPDEIFSTNKELLELNLAYNAIKKISGPSLNGLGMALKKLNMQNNLISSIDKDAFIYLDWVEEINLSHNNISDILVTAHNNISDRPFTEDNNTLLSVFYNCLSLQKLDLSYNKIDKIFTDWTTYAPVSFRELILSHNEIKRLHESDMFFRMWDDFTIDLTGNKIRRIDISNTFEQSFLQKVRSRIEMFLIDNPLECDCFLYDFIRYLNGSMPKLRDKLWIELGPMDQCSSPKELNGTPIANLKPEDYRCVATSDLEEYEGICPESCSSWRKPFVNKHIFDCAFKNLTEAPQTMCKLKSNKYIIEVNLTGNFIKNIPNMNQTGYDRVSKLVLSNNNISAIPENVFSTALLTLELDNNKINTLSPAVLAHLKNTTLQNIKLGGNPWKCDCDVRDFQHYIRSGGAEGKFRILDADRITCQNSKKVLRTMTANELCPVETEMIIGISLTIAILGLTIGTLAALYYRYQREIKVWLYAHQMCLWFVTEEELDKDKPYDAFISYSHKDEDFVVNELVPKLEEGPRPFKLCIHFRDWLAGEWIPAQITKSVRDSKRTIVVVSPNFVQSEWGRLEFRTAHSQALSEGRGRVVVILYGDIGPIDKLEPELKAYLSINTYAKWGDPWFWDKLRYFLPHKSDLPEGTPESRIFKKKELSAQLIFNKRDSEQYPLNSITPLMENAPTIDNDMKILQEENVVIDTIDDESKKLNSAC